MRGARAEDWAWKTGLGKLGSEGRRLLFEMLIIEKQAVCCCILPGAAFHPKLRIMEICPVKAH